MRKIKQLFFVWITLFCSANICAQDTMQHIIANRTNSVENQQKPYVILISADGFRYDLAQRYDAKNLLRLSGNGVQAASMKPSYPSLTFPNHYTLITGLYPAHHGLVGNSFYDRKRNQSYKMNDTKAVRDGSWYGGEPLWVLAEKNKMVSASFFWVGSETPIDSTFPTYYFNYSEAFKIDRRLQILQEWLQLPDTTRPHLITFYFPEVDHEEHLYGVDSKQAKDAVAYVDNAIGKMDSMCSNLNLPINFIFVSDHGMANTDTSKTIKRPLAIDPAKFIIPSGDAMIQLYAKDKKDIAPTYKALKKEANGRYLVYLKNKMPKRFHYNSKNDKYDRIGDIILIAYPPLAFNFGGGKSIGRHGFDNDLPDMQATFYAWGPAFKQKYKIGNFENVHVYPLVAQVLGLQYDFKIDGKLKVLQSILK